jgi:N-succinyldiaminopimelate aminotransferase
VKELLPGRLAQMPPSSFDRLRQLLGAIEPNYAIDDAPVLMTIGEPQDAPPEFVTEIIAKHARGFGHYPPIAGTPTLRASCANWLKRRYALPEGALDPDSQILPLAGTREGLFYALYALVPDEKAGGRPIVLIPNPFYGVYPAAVLAAGAEPYYVPSREETNFLPDFGSVPIDILARTVAAFYCSPSNPESAVASGEEWQSVFNLADEHDFVVLADECYSEIYDSVPPIGALEVRLKTRPNCERVLSFHSLSKRSNLPGLRSGFMVGPEPLITALRGFRNLAAPQLPLPIMEASSAAWDDDEHVASSRALYGKRFDIAERFLGNHPGFCRPKGGFYLWLNVGDGADFAAHLWAETGIRVMPGAYMGIEENPGVLTSNPGQAHVRIALVHDLVTIGRALERMAIFLNKREGQMRGRQ